MKKFELMLEQFIFNSRWLLVPFYIGLIAALGLLLVKFSMAFVALLPVVIGGDSGAALVSILTLVDITLVANLLLIIIFAGYENFVSKINTGDNEDRPEWMGHVGFSDLKLKLIGSIVAISGIELLKYYQCKRSAGRAKWYWSISMGTGHSFNAGIFWCDVRADGSYSDWNF